MVFVYLDVLGDGIDGWRLERATPGGRPSGRSRRRRAAHRPERRRVDVIEAVREIVVQDGNDAVGATPERPLARLCTALGLPSRTPMPGSTVERTVRAIEREPEAFPDVARAAAMAGLSVSRFQHVFGEITGTTFRRYRLWRRMAIVARALADGATLTDAALEAGFASPSHLSAAFRTMFGTSASTLIAAGTRFEVEPREAV